jgi:aldose 1-epimerase
MPTVRQGRIGDDEIHVLQGDNGAEASVAPGRGANCVSLRVPCRGEIVELLHGAGGFEGWPMGGRVPVLFPVTGRLFHEGEMGRYRHKGQVYDLDIHGFAKDTPWRVLNAGVDADEPQLVCELESTETTRAGYPYDFALRQTFRLEPNGLLLEAEIENRSDRPMPFSFGYHPYFRAPIRPGAGERAKCVVRIPGDQYWEMSGGAPTGRLLELPGEMNFVDGQPLTGDHLEWVVANLRRGDGEETARTELLDPGSGLAVCVEFDPGQFETVTVYSPPGAPFVCLEPRTGIPMALSDDTPAPPTGKTLSPAGRPGSSCRMWQRICAREISRVRC